MEIGVVIPLRRATDIAAEFQKAAELELDCCQLTCWDVSLHTSDMAARLKEAQEASGVRISALWAGWSGPAQWNFTGGPSTLGLVPAAFRFQRMQELLSASDFAQMIGVADIITHVGFLPENYHDPVFWDVVSALQYVCGAMARREQNFLFETGQETPITLLRAIEAVGTDNLGINLDAGNLIMYGKGNAVDSLDVFGKYVKNTHCKDGLYPTGGARLGVEVPFGEGKANFPALIKGLLDLGYDGPWIVEREISGEKQQRDIVLARDGIKAILNECGR